MNHDDIIFGNQCILESLASIDPSFTFNLAHDNDNNVTGIVCMTSYMCDNFERVGNYISINIMDSSIINIVCEGFVIFETHDAYTFVLDSLFNMCPFGNKKQVYATFSDESMIKSLLDSIGMYESFIFLITSILI